MLEPDCWVVIKISTNDEFIYKVIGGWNGGYLQGSSWRMNSGIVRAELNGEFYSFYGVSGSCYKCHKNSYGLRMSNAGIYQQLKDAAGDMIELLNNTTDWLALEFTNE